MITVGWGFAPRVEYFKCQLLFLCISEFSVAKNIGVSNVAEIDGEGVGHIAFSPVTISGRFCNWYGLGPISVRPGFQKQGIGSALVNEGLGLLKESGAKGCMLVGDPNYYKWFGFRNIPELILEGVPAENFLALPFDQDDAHGIAKFHEGFAAQS